MKKIILLIAFTGLSFVFVNAQNVVTKSVSTQPKSAVQEKVTPSKVEVKENKKENCTPEEKRN